ncbi:MEDS domain-containing protein [Streptomyces sp. NBC_01142]|uniref:MEDS domain-containing protein n=1 Tax=Streptomyces sp. NBC_01142 TaxID=2975865 RepID=UPI00225ACD38|nr:MEDS domain-containing protein [Streptomyces sp. NBC_01142]MCX4825242.1 MEDS domain-containing protein [Streptomyces sp. NBC_01142]
MVQHRAEVSSATVASVGGVPLAPGDHVCALYRGRAERNQLITPFFADGLRDGHICLLMAAQDEGRTFCDVLAATAPSAERESDHLQIRGPQGSYLHNGSFDGDRMLGLLYAWSADMFRNGDGNFARVAADMSWAQPLVQPAFIHDLVQYEVKATRWLRSRPQVGVCMYDLELFSGDLIIPLVKAHPKVWLSGMVVENPYCLGPHAESRPTAVGES